MFAAISAAVMLGVPMPCQRCGATDAAQIDALSPLDRVLLNVKEREQTLKTFTASFRQTQKSRLLDGPLISRGMIFYENSGKLLMKISHPEPFILLINDRLMLMGDPGTRTYRKKSIPGRDGLLQRYLGTGQTIEAIKKNYDIRLITDGTEPTCQLNLIPKDQIKKLPFQSIRVGIDTRTWLPVMIQMEEPTGDTTLFELTYHTINDPLPADTFDFNRLKGDE